MWIIYFLCGVFVGVALVFTIEVVNQALDRYVDGGDK